MQRRLCRSVSPACLPPDATGPAPGASRANPASGSFPLRASLPFSNGRHGRQDAFHIAAGAQAEMGAAVIEQIELDIAAAPLGLFVAFFLGPVLLHAAADAFWLVVV